MVCEWALSFAGARNTGLAAFAGQRKSCQFEPGATFMTTPMCSVMRGQVTGAVNHRIMRALYMEVRLGEPALVLAVANRSYGCPPLTTQECLV